MRRLLLILAAIAIPLSALASTITWVNEGANGSWDTGESVAAADMNAIQTAVDDNDARLDAVLSTDTCTTPPCSLESGTTLGGAAIQTGTDDDVPESGDFGAAVDLEADGSLSIDTVALDQLAACPGPDEIVEYGASGIPSCVPAPVGGNVFTAAGGVAYPIGGETLQDDASATDWSISPDGIGNFGGGVNLRGSIPTFRFYDDEATAGDVNAFVMAECDDVVNNQEDCDLFFLQQRNGLTINRVRMDADDDLDLFSQTGTYVTMGDGGTSSYARVNELGVLSFVGSGGLTAQTRTDCSTITGEGRICWDSDDDALYVGDATTAQLQAGGGGSGDITGLGSGTNGTACTSGACFDGTAVGDNLSVIDDLMIWLDDDEGTTPNSSRFEIYNGAGTLVFYVDEDGVTYSAPTATPSIALSDSDMAGTPDTNVAIVGNCPTGTTAGGDEDCDLSFQAQAAGALTEAFRIDTTDAAVQTVVFAGEIDTAAAGIEFAETASISDCSSFSATGGGIFYDDTLGKFRKCQDNTLTDLDTTAGGIAGEPLVECETFYAPNDSIANTDDVPSIWRAPAALTITSVWCESDEPTATFNLQKDDGGPANLFATAEACDGVEATTFVSTQDTFAANDRLDFIADTMVGSTTNRLTVCWEFDFD